MVDTLFLEDCDLLDNVLITKQINEFREAHFDIDDLLSEQEMMTSMYEDQRFLVEQDTQIFMYLEYGFIHEGVVEKIKNAILFVINKIKELFGRLINFITGRRKKQSTQPKIQVNDIKNNIKKTKQKIESAKKRANEVKYFNEQKKNIDELEELNRRLKQMDTEKNCIPVIVDISKIENLEFLNGNIDFGGVLEDIIEILDNLNNPKLKQEYDEVKNVGIDPINKMKENLKEIKEHISKMYDELQTVNTELLIIKESEKCSINEYEKLYLEKLSYVYCDISDDIISNGIKKLEQIKKETEPTLKRITQELKKYNESTDKWISDLLKLLYDEVSIILKGCNYELTFVYRMQRVYDIHMANLDIIDRKYRVAGKIAEKLSGRIGK